MPKLPKFVALMRAAGMNKQQIKSLLGIDGFTLRAYMNGQPVPPDKMAKLEKHSARLSEARNIDRLIEENKQIKAALDRAVLFLLSIDDQDDMNELKDQADAILDELQGINGNK